MPTIPQERARANEPHRHRQVAESFGTDPGRYDRSRPSYPAALVDRIVAALPGPDVLDVGCGTGTAARQFRRAGCRVLGVEPDARMAEFARHSGLDAEVARFEDWDPAGREYDGVVAGTAWHWVDPVAGAAKAARVLRPGGRLAPFWHVMRLAPAVVDAFAAAYRRVVPDSPFDFSVMKQGLAAYQALLTKAADGMRDVGAFGEPHQWRYDWQRSYTRDEWLDYLSTTGGITSLPRDKAAAVLEAVAAAVDADGGTVTVPYSTVVVIAARAGTA